MKKMIVVLLAIATLSACNTIHGMGQDLENAGESISDSAQKTKEKM